MVDRISSKGVDSSVTTDDELIAQNIDYAPAGTGAVATTVEDKLRHGLSVSVFDFLSELEKADVLSGNPVLDHSAAIQAAYDYAATLSFKSTSVRDYNTSHFRTPVEVDFGRGYYRGKNLFIVNANVSLHGNGAILELSDQSTWLQLYAPWDGGWQGGLITFGELPSRVKFLITSMKFMVALM